MIEALQKLETDRMESETEIANWRDLLVAAQRMAAMEHHDARLAVDNGLLANATSCQSYARYWNQETRWMLDSLTKAETRLNEILAKIAALNA